MIFASQGTNGTNKGTFLEVVEINFSQYCKNVYPYCHQISSQGLFVSKLFVAGGSSFFSTSANADKEYQKKLYNGSKPLTQNLKDSFPANIQLDALVSLFGKHLNDDQVRQAMSAFAIPVSLVPAKDTFSRALALQFCCLIKNEDSDVDDIVAMEYQRFLTEPADEQPQSLAPLYPGDSAYVLEFLPARIYSKKCYEQFEHTWVIRNTGNQTWRGRKLVFVNRLDVRPRVDTNSIDIPDTAPGKDIKITTSFDARGFEGHYECFWEMQDSEGNDCFPNNQRLFNVTIDTKFEVI